MDTGTVCSEAEYDALCLVAVRAEQLLRGMGLGTAGYMARLEDALDALVRARAAEQEEPT